MSTQIVEKLIPGSIIEERNDGKAWGEDSATYASHMIHSR